MPAVIREYRSILCLQGGISQAMIALMDVPVIAADGAANFLHEIGVVPDYIIGDLDSINSSCYARRGMIHLTDQETCDFEKAMTFIKQQDLMPCLVLGVGGGAIDHVFNNLNLIINYGCDFYSEPIFGRVIQEIGCHEFISSTQEKVSIFGAPNAQISSSGLVWELENETLRFPGAASLSNRTKYDKFQIDLRHGSILVFWSIPDFRGECLKVI